MELIDAAFNTFKKILSEIHTYDDSIFSEQDSRVKIIDRILIEVLNYPLRDILTEPKAGKGFIDYKIILNDVPRLIVEAKKDGLDFDIDKTYSGRAFQLSGSVFKDKAVQEGLDQGIYYAAHASVELGCLTNGRTWLVYKANRLGDGKNVLEGKGFVFSTLEMIEKNFKLFYELLSPEGINDLRYRALFQEAEGAKIRAKEFHKSLKDENTLRLIEKEAHSHDFDRVMTEFFSQLSGDSDPDLITECFVETKESKVAEAGLIRISGELISKIRTLETYESSILQDIIERVKQTNRHEFVIIVGGKGAGKSTFIDRFFNNILSESMKDSCVLIKINLGENNGDVNSIGDWMDQNLLEELEKVMFNGRPTYDDLMGIFHFEYMRLLNGPWAGLYKKDKEQFKIDFGKHVEVRRESRPNEHIKRLIGDITKSRKKVPVIIFDNADHHGIDFQETVFQYARALYEKEICLVVVPITDKTSWQLSKQGAIQSYENETLFLPTPPPKKIIEKRIEFLEKKLIAEKEAPVKYFIGRGIKIELTNIQKFVKFLQSIFLKDENISKWIGSLSNFDIRRCLDLTRKIISSPHISLEDFLKTYYIDKSIEDLMPIKPYKIKNALIKLNYSSYPIGHHPFVQNVFYLTKNINTSPILSIRILQALLDRSSDRNAEDKFLLVDQILDYFSAMEIDRTIVIAHLDHLLKKGLIYSFDPTIINIEDSKKVELSPSGHQHYVWALNDEDYLHLLMEVTPITDRILFQTFYEKYYDWHFKYELMKDFVAYLISEDALYCHVPNHIAYKGQTYILTKLAHKMKTFESKFVNIVNKK